MPDLESPFVSIVIPVYNDADVLRECLTALLDQTYSSDRYEILVVDNGSDAPLDEVVATHPRARLLAESRPGSYAARNRGIAAARGHLLGFTDADCVPASDWIEQGVRCLVENPEIGLVAGGIDVVAEEGASSRAVERYQRIRAFPQRENVEVRHYGPTANVFSRRSIFDDVGGFNAELKSGGDREWGQRVWAAGHPVVYADAVRISHRARASFSELYTKVTRVVGGQRDRAVHEGRPLLLSTCKDVLRSLVPPLSMIRKVWAEGDVRGFTPRLEIAYVCVFIGWATAFERVRLSLGGRSKRR